MIRKVPCAIVEVQDRRIGFERSIEPVRLVDIEMTVVVDVDRYHTPTPIPKVAPPRDGFLNKDMRRCATHVHHVPRAARLIVIDAGADIPIPCAVAVVIAEGIAHPVRIEPRPVARRHRREGAVGFIHEVMRGKEVRDPQQLGVPIAVHINKPGREPAVRGHIDVQCALGDIGECPVAIVTEKAAAT